MFQKLIDNLPVTAADVAENTPLPSGRVEELLVAAGASPIGRMGRFNLWSADDVLRHVLRMDPVELRANRPTEAA